MKQYRYVKALIPANELDENYGFFDEEFFMDGYTEPFDEFNLERDVENYADWCFNEWRRINGYGYECKPLYLDLASARDLLMARIEEI